MSYSTNLTQHKRNQLKMQMDDFATFQWRGHHMFDDFGCFIINEQKGSLKFYNGPSFTNQYAKTQFSSSVNALLGVDFKQQTIPMKVGLYWFTIEEYQKFLECIGPYQVNYITFDFDDKYGYLVKSGKIADSIKYVVGTDEDGQKRYYTELDLTWEVLGDPCVRSNLAYEYYSTINSASALTECIWTTKYPSSYPESEKAGKFVGDMIDASLLDTPMVFEIPCYFTNSEASLKLEAILDEETITEAGEESTSSITLESQTITLFDLELQNLTSAIDAKCRYNFDPTTINESTENENIYYSEEEIYETVSCIISEFDTSEGSETDTSEGSETDTSEGSETDTSEGSETDTSEGSETDTSEGSETDTSEGSETDTSEGSETLLYEVTSDSDNFKITCKFTLTKVTTVDGEEYTDPNSPEGWTIDFDKGEIIIPKSSVTDEFTITIAGKKSLDFNAESFQHKQFMVEYEQKIYDNIAHINSIDSASSNVIVYNSDSEEWSPLDFNETEKTVEIVCKKSGIDSSLHNYLTWSAFVFEADWGSSESLYQLYLRYDSETGLIYIQSGSQTSWYLLNYQTDNTNGELLLESFNILKWKVPGQFTLPDRKTTDWKFKLTYSGIDLTKTNSEQRHQAITMYSRKNVI